MNCFTHGNEVVTSYSYYDENSGTDLSARVSNSFRLKSMLIENQTSIGLTNTAYQYDKKDNVARKEFANDFSDHYLELYSYDSFDRLTMAESSSNNGIEIYGTKTYTYDILNNILSKDGNIYTYSHWTGTSPHAVQSVSGSVGINDYLYDSNGNMITKLLDSVVTRSIVFDTENRITSMSDGGSYVYDSAGQRIKKTEGSVTTYYFFPNYEEEHDGAVVTKIKDYFANGLRVAQYSESTGLQYFHLDHLRMHSRAADEVCDQAKQCNNADRRRRPGCSVHNLWSLWSNSFSYYKQFHRGRTNYL